MSLPLAPALAEQDVSIGMLPPTPEEARRDQLYLAKVADECQLYKDMACAMNGLVKRCIELKSPMTVEERLMLLRGYKKYLGESRKAFQVALTLEAAEVEENHQHNLKLIGEVKEVIAAEISLVCNEIAALVGDYVRICESGNKETAIYHQIIADFHRYLCEVSGGDTKEERIKETEKYYQTAYGSAKELPADHYIRLAVQLNYAIFLATIRNLPQEAITRVEEALGNAQKVEKSTADPREALERDHTIALLRDNLEEWKKVVGETPK